VFHHPKRIARFPDITVAKYWYGLHRLFQLANCVPPGISGVMLLSGASMQRDRSHTFFGRDPTSI
jgi:hypothetical protein